MPYNERNSGEPNSLLSWIASKEAEIDEVMLEMFSIEVADVEADRARAERSEKPAHPGLEGNGAASGDR